MSEFSRGELDDALARLRHLLPDAEGDVLQPMGPATVYTAAVTLHLMPFQRLSPNATLRRVVDHLLDPACPDHRPDRSLSHNTADHSAARIRGPSSPAAASTPAASHTPKPPNPSRNRQSKCHWAGRPRSQPSHP